MLNTVSLGQRNKHIFILFLLQFCLLLILLTGCGKDNAASKTENVAAEKRIQEEAAPGSDQSYSVMDDTGRKIVMKEKPKRIVSVTYGTDEILKVLAGPERIVAYSRHAGEPEISFLSAEDVKRVGKKVENNSESIFGLQPDLVVISTSTGAEALKTLESMGVPVYVALSPKNYKEMKQKVKNLGRAVGEPEKTEKLLQRMDERMAALEKRMRALPDEKRKVAVAFSMTGPMGRKGELFDSMMNMAHVINGAATVHPLGLKGQISKEQVVQVDPDLFILPTWNYDKRSDPKQFEKELREDPAYRNVKAVKNNQLVYVSDRYRYAASHHMVDAIENIAFAVYPELFPEGRPKDQE
ncbi:MAG: ABC transporter substrate-binding protein [Acidaminococcaceae bacterium]|nr:ABC transporter substrate-binding protein [Acidaminococcaceae bacterium]